MRDRLARLRTLLTSLKVEALLVTDDTNVSYLCGYPSHEAWVVVTARSAFYITDSRYTLEASLALKNSSFVIVEFKDSIFQTVADLLIRAKVLGLGVDANHLTLGHYQRLKALCQGKIRIKALQNPVEHLRMIKEPGEVDAIRSALEINLKAFDWISARLKPGKTEQEILRDLEHFVRKRGVGFSFPPIIASGPNAAKPHARVTARKLRAGEPVLIDLGIEKDRYKSDLTRMFFLGKMPTSFHQVLCIVRDAQAAAIRFIRPGVLARDVDAAARNYLKKHGLDQYFGHSLGHGVGLDIHEMPRISAKSGVTLAENMVITVEPGVYFPNKYGIRLEEMVLVTQQGCEVLSGDRNY